MKWHHWDEPVNVRTQMIFACIPIASFFVFLRIKKFWYAAGVSLPFAIAFDYLDKFVSNPDLDPMLVIAITFPSLAVWVFVMLYVARRWSIAWNKEIAQQQPSTDFKQGENKP